MEALAHHQFEPLLQQEFQLCAAGDVSCTLVLERVDTASAPMSPGGRCAFSLLFRGPADRVLAQRTYELRQDLLGVLHLFLVPVGMQEDGVRYQAVFT